MEPAGLVVGEVAIMRKLTGEARGDFAAEIVLPVLQRLEQAVHLLTHGVEFLAKFVRRMLMVIVSHDSSPFFSGLGPVHVHPGTVCPAWQDIT